MKKEDIKKAAQDYDDSLIYSSVSEQCDVQKAFKAGAKWRFENVWHYTDKELPQIGKHVVTDEEGWLDFIANDKNDLKRIIKKYQFKRWAYVDDLKPMED